ncbi:hypothetical protein EDD30_6510 [Couchioplanes caeruleus]|uniref:Uncharacterized protein n=2 Tax=Couchioplanes caeruleus TaxID=56438 RepID=A0A3N1GTC1_9ACTN|nr:hypothetical protein EDD30_6510 [Couchioplanes caeruleus]
MTTAPSETNEPTEEPTTTSPKPEPTKKATTRPTATTSPPSPRYTATRAQLLQAEADVASAKQAFQEAQADPGSSPEDVQVALYEYKAAIVALQDLKDGTPGKFHRSLEIEGAKAYLAQAQMELQVLYNTSGVDQGDIAQAEARVARWQERLAELKAS